MCSLKLGISRCALAPQRHGAGFIPILHTSSNESFLLVKIGRGNGLKQCIRSFPFTELTLHPKHPQIRRHASKVHSVFSSSNERNDQLSNSDGVSEDSWPASTGSPPHHPPGEAEPRQQRPGFLRRIALSVLSIIAALSPVRLRTILQRQLASVSLRLVVFFGLGFFFSLMGHFGSRGGRSTAPQEVVYSEFLRLVDSGNVRAARFEDGTGRILFDLKAHSSVETPDTAAIRASGAGSSTTVAGLDGMAYATPGGRSRAPRQFYTRHLPDPQLLATLMAAGVEFGSVRATLSSAISRVLFTALALWIPLIPMFIIMRRFMEGRGGSRKPRKSGTKTGVPPTTFADVAGVGPAKEELKEVVACLRDSKRFARLGAKLPSGVLLCGPPGTGKTLLAKAVAGEAGVPFLAVSASEFVELFVGRGAARIRELFTEARRCAPCVVFIDELDAVGGKRGAGLNEERDQTLNQLLTELDGFEGRPGVLLLAATNRAEVLDPALLRPGRLSRKVNVTLPDLDGRAAILEVYLRKVPLEGGKEAVPATAAALARITAGLSGAELANVTNEAAFLAARRDAAYITLYDLSEAVSRTRFGVNGGARSPGGLVEKLQKWALDAGSGGTTARTQPLGG